MASLTRIDELKRDLDARRTHTPSSLGASLQRGFTLDDVAAFVRFDPTNYVRSLVARGEHWEVRLLCWRPGQTSTLHGHGPAACAFRVVCGSAVETVLGSRDRVHCPGTVVEEQSQRLVHQVGNAGTDSLLTLHTYSPALPVDAPSPREGRNIVVVGGGFGGVAVATHLLRRAESDVRITLIERGPWLGRGVAYGVDSEVFRLNVPASRMSLDPETPGDFVRWASAEDAPHAFLPRTRYGAYVVERFGDALRRSEGKLRVVRGDAASIERDAVTLTNGVRVPAEVVVLATGVQQRPSPGALPDDARIVDAWDERSIAALPHEGRLLVLGAGLTALDVITFLHARGFSGKMTVVSRRGLLPFPHLATFSSAAPLRPELLDGLPKDLRSLVRWTRDVIHDVQGRGQPWQHAIDAIRPHIVQLWSGLPAKDRKRFVRSVRPYWEVLRHRAPTEALAVVEERKARGDMELLAGSLVSCIATDDGLLVEIRQAGGKVRRERYDALVRCIGPALDRSEADAPLVRGLIEQGRATPDVAKLGIVTDMCGHILNATGLTDGSLFALGALRRASAWETTSVPDIAVDALAIAKAILP